MHTNSDQQDYHIQETSTNFIGGVIGALIGAVIGIIIWALVAYLLERSVGYIAILVGFLIGLFAQKLARTPHAILSGIVALIALVSIFFGNAALITLLVSKYEGIKLMDLLPQIDFVELLKYTFTKIDFYDILFMGLATYTAYSTANARPHMKVSSATPYVTGSEPTQQSDYTAAADDTDESVS